MFSSIWNDLVFGLRTLIHKPGFAIIAMLSLALGIGANTAVFSLINGLLLRPLDFPEADRVFWIRQGVEQNPNQQGSMIGPDYFTLREQNRSFEVVGASWLNALSSLGASADGQPAERILGQQVTSGVFEALGVTPAMGRTIEVGEDVSDQIAPVMVLSDRLWKRRFGGKPDVVGQEVRLDGVNHTIIGVMPPGFHFFNEDAEFWKPVPIEDIMLPNDGFRMQIVARLKPGVSMEQAQAELEAFHAQRSAETPERFRGTRYWLQPLAEGVYGSWRDPLFLLQGAVAFVLLIGCANVAGLLLARASTRRTEIAVRSAIGASRGRIVGQLITESVPLALLSGVLGIFLAWAGLQLFLALAPPGYFSLTEFPLDFRVLAFTLGITLLTSVIFALAPAWQAAAVDLTSSLKEVTRGGGDTRQWLRSSLVAGQIGLSLVLLIGAGLLINGFLRVSSNPLGGNPEDLLTFDVRFSQNEALSDGIPYHIPRLVTLYLINPQIEQVAEQTVARLREIPGVESAAAATARPYNGAFFMQYVKEGQPRPEPGQQIQGQNAGYIAVTDGYFSTMGIPILRGRDFDDRDTASAPPVIIINKVLADQQWPGEDPVGKFMQLDYVAEEPQRQIVGVVDNVRTGRYQPQFPPLMYVPAQQQAPRWIAEGWQMRAGFWFVVRAQNAKNLLPTITKAMSGVDSNHPIGNIATTEEYLGQQVQYDRLNMVLLTTFGAIAVILAAIGIYGVMTYSVAERTREIGIRMALGATSGKVFRLVLFKATILIFIGLAAGLGAAYAMTQLIASRLYQVSPTDPLTFTVVSVVLVAIALMACLIPTLRAIRVDPNLALRHE